MSPTKTTQEGQGAIALVVIAVFSLVVGGIFAAILFGLGVALTVSLLAGFGMLTAVCVVSMVVTFR